MSDDFQSIDLIFLAAIAGFLIYKLYQVLGKREGNFRSSAETADIISLGERRAGGNAEGMIIDHEDPDLTDLDQLRKADTSFDVSHFLGGAKVAYEMIFKALNQGDLVTLKPLLSPRLYAHFSQEIKKRKRQGEVYDYSLIRIQKVNITKAKLDDFQACLTVEFVSEQIRVIRDTAGEVARGDPDQIEIIKDYWIFSRDIRSSDPNWQLQATETLS